MIYQCSIQIGRTPLHYASENGHTDVVELLINHDAHIDVPAEVGVGINSLYLYSVTHDSFRRLIVLLL